MDRISVPDSRSGNPLHFPARARRQDGSHSAVFAGAKSRTHDVAQQGRHSGAKTASAAAGTGAGAVGGRAEGSRWQVAGFSLPPVTCPLSPSSNIDTA